MLIVHGLGLLLSAAMAFAQNAQARADTEPPLVEAIMSQVAANQDRSEKALRGQYRSVKHIHIATSARNGKMMREETADYDIDPTAETRVRLRSLRGRYWHKGKFEDFTGEPVPATGSWDADYIRDVRMCLTGEQSRCARAPELFPLTTEEQKQL
jgi:hypothetical protein